MTVPKSPNYRKPIKGLGDILASIWRGKKGREAKRRARRESLRWMTSWWYDPKHYWGLRHIAFWIAVALALVLLVTTHVVGFQLCAQHVGCAYTQDGSVHAGPTAAAPSVVTP